jgi:hypothetical protein
MRMDKDRSTGTGESERRANKEGRGLEGWMGQETCAGGDGRKEIVPLNQPTRQATAQPHPFHTLAFVRLCTLRCSSHDEIEGQEGKWHKGEKVVSRERVHVSQVRDMAKKHTVFSDEVRGAGREGTTEGRDAARLQEHLGPG